MLCVAIVGRPYIIDCVQNLQLYTTLKKTKALHTKHIVTVFKHIPENTFCVFIATVLFMCIMFYNRHTKPRGKTLLMWFKQIILRVFTAVLYTLSC